MYTPLVHASHCVVAPHNIFNVYKVMKKKWVGVDTMGILTNHLGGPVRISPQPKKDVGEKIFFTKKIYIPK